MRRRRDFSFRTRHHDVAIASGGARIYLMSPESAASAAADSGDRPTMSRWNSPEWAALCSGATCPICRLGAPEGVVCELSASYLTSSTNGPMRGCCCVVLRRHAVELHDLSRQEAADFMHDVQRVGRALLAVTEAVKLNYEIHGNSIPHLHMHLYPRHPGDPFEGRPIDPASIEASPYAAGEFERFIEALRAKIEGG
jgi:diadenosine tetraphosphate (Ap4A) HIT family hydrolase